MQPEGLQTNNLVTMVGTAITEMTFSHDIYGEGFYKFDLEVARLSQIADILPVTVSERLTDPGLIQPGNHVHISGQIRSYNNYSHENSKSKLILTLFAREIYQQSENDDLNSSQHINEVYLDGFICKPPIYRTTPFGREIADLLLAVNRSYGKSDYIPCIAWGRNARFAAKLQTGDRVRLWGRMQSRSYQKKLESGDVSERVAFEISISKMEQPNEKEAEQ